MKESKQHRYLFGIWLILILLFFSIWLLYTQIGTLIVNPDIFWSSDAAYIPLLFKDVISRRVIAGWNLPPAPFYFPDMVIYAVSLLGAKGNLQLGVVLYGIVQFFLIVFFALFFIHNLFKGRNCPKFILAFWLSLIPASIMIGHDIWLIFFVPVYHAGMSLSSIMTFSLMAFLSREIVNRRIQFAFILIFSITALSVFSDPLYIASTALPLVAGLLAMKYLRVELESNVKRAISYVWLGVISGLGGGLLTGDSLNKLLHYRSVNTSTSHLVGFNDLLLLFSIQYPFEGLILSFVLLSSILYLWHLLQNGKRNRTVSDANGFHFFFVIILAINTTTFSLGMAFLNQIVPRYMIPGLMPAMILGPTVLISSLPIKYSVAIRNVTFLAIVLLYTLLLKQSQLVSNPFDLSAKYYPGSVRCFDLVAKKHKLRRGISGYDLAKHFTLLSRQEIEIVQVMPSLYPWLWINNSKWYQGIFDFAIVNRQEGPTNITENVVVQKFGRPSVVENCEGFDILLYSDNDLFNHQFAGHPGLSDFRKSGSDYTFYPRNLPFLTGAVSGFGVEAREGVHKANFIVQGLGLSLPSGKYKITIDTSKSTSTNTPILGSWEIVVHQTDVFGNLLSLKKISEGNFYTNRSILSSIVEIKHNTNVEIRAYYGGQGNLLINSIQLAHL